MHMLVCDTSVVFLKNILIAQVLRLAELMDVAFQGNELYFMLVIGAHQLSWFLVCSFWLISCASLTDVRSHGNI